MDKKIIMLIPFYAFEQYDGQKIVKNSEKKIYTLQNLWYI